MTQTEVYDAARPGRFLLLSSQTFKENLPGFKQTGA
jgi:hypothetical protein